MKTVNSHCSDTQLAKFAKENELNLTEVKHARVAYLYHIESLARKEIAEITGYAASTLSAMKDKVVDLLDKAKEWFGKTQYVVKRAISNFTEDLVNTKGNWFYLMRFYNKGQLVFSKIGTTERTVKKRTSEHLGYYNTHNCEVDDVKIDRVYDCGNIPCECLESFFRSHYILKHPGTFKKNDRFFDVEFDLKEADQIVNSIFEQAGALA